MGLMHDLVDVDHTDGRDYLADAFSLALDDFGEHRDEAPTLADAAVIVGALAVMARIEPGELDPVYLVAEEQEVTARLLVDRCAAYAPLLAVKAPLLDPWISTLARAGTLVDAARDGETPGRLDQAWIGKLALTAFRLPAARKYLATYLDRALGLLATGGGIAGALVLCLKFRRWWQPSARQRTMLGEHVSQEHDAHLRPLMDAALRKLDAAA
jgi:hypothetical protein